MHTLMGMQTPRPSQTGLAASRAPPRIMPLPILKHVAYEKLLFIPVFPTLSRSPVTFVARGQPESLPPLTQLPSGARLEPTLPDPISHRLQNLTFGYEQPTSLAPCRLRYRCQQGHLISCKPGSRACQTCPSCFSQTACPQTNRSRRKLSLCELKALAIERRGELLSTDYSNSRTPLLWRCEKGHVWKANASNVRNAGSWCPECARRKRKGTLEDMRMIARERGGECLSQEYISEHVKLKWRCAAGHEFWLPPNNVNRSLTGARKPSWCKICAKENRRRSSQKKNR